MYHRQSELQCSITVIKAPTPIYIYNAPMHSEIGGMLCNIWQQIDIVMLNSIIMQPNLKIWMIVRMI